MNSNDVIAKYDLILPSNLKKRSNSSIALDSLFNPIKKLKNEKSNDIDVLQLYIAKLNINNFSSSENISKNNDIHTFNNNNNNTVSYNNDDFMNAIENKNVNIISKLINNLKNADCTIKTSLTNSRETLLTFGINIYKNGTSDIEIQIITMLAINTEINSQNFIKRTALMIAVEYENIEFIKIFINMNCDPNIQDINGLTALHIAASSNKLSIIKLLLSIPNIDINIQSFNGLTPLAIAIKTCNINIIDYLITIGSDVDKLNLDYLKITNKLNNKIFIQVDTDGIITSSKIKSQIIRMLNRNTNKTLYHAVKFGLYAQTKSLLIINNLDPNFKIRNYYTNKYTKNIFMIDETPLFKACSNNYPSIVKLLLDHGASTTILTSDNLSPLYIAAKKGYYDICKILLEFNTNVVDLELKLCINLFDEYKFTPIYISSYYKNINITDLLLDHNADANLSDIYGLTPLHLSIINFDINIMKLLVLKGKININALAINFITPVYLASFLGFALGVKFLIDKNCDIYQHNIYNITPLLIAKYNNDYECIKLLNDKIINDNLIINDNNLTSDVFVKDYNDVTKILNFTKNLLNK